MAEIETRSYEQLPEATSLSPTDIITMQSPEGPAKKISVARAFSLFQNCDAALETVADLTTDAAAIALPVQSLAVVYANPDPTQSGYWVKTSATGSGAWALTDIQYGYAAGYASQAGTAKDAAETASIAASEFADLAEVAALTLDNIYADTAAGLAAVSEGGYFWTSNPLKLWRDVLGVAVEQDAPATRAALGASDGALLVRWILDGSGPSARDLQSRLREGLIGTVKDIDEAAGGGEDDDTAAIEAAFANREDAGKNLLFGKGTYVCAQISRTEPGMSFSGDGASLTKIKAKTGLTGPQLNMLYSSSNFYGEFGGFTLDMTDAPDQLAAKFNDIHRGKMRGINIIGGAGFEIGAGGDMRLSDMFYLNPSEYGFIFDGDIGSEQYISDTLVRVTDPAITAEAGYYGKRTTGVDTGALYFRQSRVTRGGGTLNNGYKFKCTGEDAPSMFALGHGTVADNINGSGACYNFINVKDCMFHDGFGRGSAAGGVVRLENTQDIFFAGNDMDNGPSGKLWNFVGTEVRPTSDGNKMVQGIAYNFGDDAAVTAFAFRDFFTSNVTLTNSGTKLVNSFTEAQASSPVEFITHPSGGPLGMVRFVDPINNKRFSVRNANGRLEFFNNDDALVVSLDNAGIGEFLTAVHVAGQQVVGARGDAIANPTGGSVVDVEARAALVALLDHFRGWLSIST